MEFENEATLSRMSAEGRTAKFHSEYEEALAEVVGELGDPHPIYIGGKAVYTKGTFEDRNPSDTDQILGLFQRGSGEEASLAVASSQSAFRGWAQTDWKERSRLLQRTADLLSHRKFELAALMSLENGKNRAEAMADVDEAIDFLRWYPRELERNGGFDLEMGRAVPNERTRSVLRPYGVWAVISPFNFPLAIACGMTAGALVTGNTAVLKPASDTPLIALRLYEIFLEAGLPEGVLNYVTGPGGSVGSELVTNPFVSGLIFTGSRQVGLSSFKSFTDSFPKPVITELGGKNPVILSEKADLDKAVPGVGRGAFGFGGQKCSATSRVYVHEGLKDEFLEGLVDWTEGLRIGNPTEKETYLGPLINQQAYTNYQTFAASAARDGKLVTGGHAVKDGEHSKGYFVEPTIVDGLARDHQLFREELFVPLVCITSISSLEEGLSLSNDSEYGLCAGIFTEDEEERERFFLEIQAGVAYCNRVQGATTGAVVGAQPFGGWKQSGISGKGAGSLYYLQQFMREQSQTYYL